MPQRDQHGRFVWHELMTNDPAAAEKFYHAVVGWTTSQWQNDADYSMWMAGETPIGGLMKTPPDETHIPPNWLAYVEVADVDETSDRVLALGGAVVVSAQTIPGVGRFAVFKDPQGVVFAAITNAVDIGEESDPKPLEFSWHELITPDFAAAVEFYHNIFGWVKKDEFDMGDMGPYYMFGRDRFTYGGMMSQPKDWAGPPRWMHYVRVHGAADAAADRARASGGTVINGPMEVPGGDRIATILDPQGAVFSVHSKANA